MLKTLIVDDERLARVSIQNQLGEYADISVIGQASNVEEALNFLSENEVDVVFLDIQMPEQDGFELLAQCDKVNFDVVFVTAYDDFAVRAFEVSAFDYLLKPVDRERLDRVVSRLLQQNSHKSEKLIQNQYERLGPEDKFFIKDGERCWFVTLKDVFLFESQGNYVQVFFKDQKPLMLKSLNLLEERLDAKKFFRANRKHIINLDYIERVETWFNGGLMVHMKNGLEIEVSRRQAAKFKNDLAI